MGGELGAAIPAYLFGCLVAFVVAVDAIRAVRPDLLTDPDPAWWVPRLLLGLLILIVSTSAGGVAAAVFLASSRTIFASRDLEPLALSRTALWVIGAAALIFGVLVRFAWLDRIPSTVWYDEVLAVTPSLALAGRWSDFADAIRSVPPHEHSTAFAGVLYLEGFRFALRSLGTTLFAIRFPSALWGSLSLVTAMLLARTLLPRGGAVVAGLALAGLRWQLILGRFAWNALALAPILDLATLCLIRARRTSARGPAFWGGLVAGVGAHVYLGSWIAAAGLAGFLAWPSERRTPLRRRLVLAGVFGLGFLLVASPIFFLKKNREADYFVRGTDQNLMRDVRLYGWMIPFSIVSDSLKAPWLIPDPVRRHDIRKSRLGWIVGFPVALAFLRALRWPRDELSALLFPHAGAAVAASLRWGFPGHPNGYRFVYLTTLTAVAAAAGVLCLLALVPLHHRRAATWVALGLIAGAGLIGARDALLQWGDGRDTFQAYWGESTLVGRAALRWQNFGTVRLDANLPHPLVVQWVRDLRLDPDDARNRMLFAAAGPRPPAARRCFRIRASGNPAQPPERRVETIQDAWGSIYGAVLAVPCGGPERLARGLEFIAL